MNIIAVTSEMHLNLIRELFTEYAEWMDYECCFDSFQQELDNLPGEYAFENQGGLWLAIVDDFPAGCIALKKVDDVTCEMKRLWVRKQYRGQKLGQKLVDHFFKTARELRYTTVTLETTDRMSTAIELYQSLGFSITHRTENIINMSLTLSSNR